MEIVWNYNFWMKHYLLIFLIILFTGSIFGQEKKPKVALVLSGGGAKGIAHIPLLQKLDSLGIVPDIVIGTSMGSIIGGMYSVGYSGDSIADIAHAINWKSILGGKVLLSNVGVEEKSEFNRYFANLNLVDGKPSLRGAIINDQNLRGLLSELTYPVYRVDDFDDLPIPYRAVTTDIVKGQQLLMESGSLAVAMRASMSIPTIFKSVDYQNTLLIDGGVLNNFPTDIAKQLGADIIIGSDVGGGMVPKEELNNPINILFQTSMLNSNLKQSANRGLCDVLIDHIPYLTFSTADFMKSDEIYKQGKTAVNDNLQALISIAQQLKEYPKARPTVPNVPKKFVLDSIAFVNLDPDNLDLVKARFNIEEGKTYSIQEINEGIGRLLGTTLFNAIYLNPIIENKKLGIELDMDEISKNMLKGGIHFDTRRGVGLVVNYTGRNIIGKASRSLITLDIAEQPGVRLQHQKIFGNNKNWWWRTDILGQLLQEDAYLEGKKVDNLKHNFFLASTQFNRTIEPLRSYLGLGIYYQYDRLWPDTDPEINNSDVTIKNFKSHSLEASLKFHSNSTESVFFPTQGTIISAFLNKSLISNIDIALTQDVGEVKGVPTSGYVKFGVDIQKLFSVNSSITLITSLAGYFTAIEDLKSGEVAFEDFGIMSKYFLGGILDSPRMESFQFPGLYSGEVTATQVIKSSLGIQFNPINNIYFTPHCDLASLGFQGFNDYFNNFSNQANTWSASQNTSLLFSAGSTLSYYSLIGPINLDISYVNDIDKFRLFFSVGIPLGKSN